MKYFTNADWAVVIIYLAAIIGVGVYMSRGQKNARDYFLGGKNMPWWGVAFSIIATETSALTFVGVPAMAYGPSHLTFIQIIIGYVIARIFLAIVMVPLYFKGEIYSPYQLLENTFGPGARRMASVLFIIAAVLGAGVRVYVTCIPLQLIFGFTNDKIVWVIVFFVVLSLTYTIVGGVKSAIWAEAVQFLLFMGGGIFTLIYIPTLIEGGWSGAMKIAADGGKLHWLNSGFNLAMPFNIWMGIIGATFMVMSTHGADQLIVQRVLSCKSVTDGRKALVLTAIVILPLFLIFLLVGTMLWVYYQHHPEMPIPIPTAPGAGQKTDYVFPIFILTVVPPVLKGFLIVAILSAAMSSVTAALSALSSVFTMDLFKGLSKKQRSDEFYMQFGRKSMVLWAVLLIIVATAAQQVESALSAALGLNGLTNGAMLGGLLLVLFWRKGPSLPVIVGMASAVAVMIYVSFFLKWEAPSPAGEPLTMKIAWPWFTLIGTTIMIVVAWLTRLVTGEKHVEPQTAGSNAESNQSQKSKG